MVATHSNFSTPDVMAITTKKRIDVEPVLPRSECGGSYERAWSSVLLLMTTFIKVKYFETPASLGDSWQIWFVSVNKTRGESFIIVA